MGILITILLAIHILVSLLIILIVLMQRPKNEGLGAAFGGGVTDNIFGAQTTNVLAKGTRYLAGIFFVLTLVLSVLYARQNKVDERILSERLGATELEEEAPAAGEELPPAEEDEPAPPDAASPAAIAPAEEATPEPDAAPPPADAAQALEEAAAPEPAAAE